MSKTVFALFTLIFIAGCASAPKMVPMPTASPKDLPELCAEGHWVPNKDKTGWVCGHSAGTQLAVQATCVNAWGTPVSCVAPVGTCIGAWGTMVPCGGASVWVVYRRR